MTTIAIDLNDAAGVTPARVVGLLRRMNSNRHWDVVTALAGAIEAAADKRVIVLDVDALGLTDPDPEVLRRWQAPGHLGTEMVRIIVRAVADALDSLTPPRPPEPTGLGAVVRTGNGETWVRYQLGTNAPWHNVSDDTHRPYRYYKHAKGPIEVLSEGVTS